MTEALVSEAVSPGFTRLGRPATTTVSDLGPLADLVGTWTGVSGLEVIAVPVGPSFKLIVRPYVEVLTVAPIGAPVPNRGGPAGDLFITGVVYETRISDAETAEPLHVENGMWLYMEGEDPAIARLSSVPHGDSILALGSASMIDGPPPISDESPLPDGQPPDVHLGYLDQYSTGGFGFDRNNYNAGIQKVIADQVIVATTTLDVSTANGGSIANIPFVNRHAATTRFSSVFWIETVRRAPNGTLFQQLQYSQNTAIEFLPKAGAPPGGLIEWPHTNTATLIKQ